MNTAQLKFEDVFDKNKEISRLHLSEMLAFIGLDFDERFIDRLDITVDEYRNVTDKKINSKDIASHNQTIELAKKLGYKINGNKDLSRYKRSKNYSRKIINKAVSIIKMFFI
ncbi:MAG: hypothetical protein U5K69_01050 [Balneolaceae bacterium]|nr:hypothetical protein [Balneolaceae bacterium]